MSIKNAKFKIGDKVDFVNDYGVIFRDKVIESVEINHNGVIGYITEDSQTKWYASPERNFYPAGEYQPKNFDIKLNNGTTANFIRYSDWGEKIFSISEGESSFNAILVDGFMYSMEGDFEEAGFKLTHEYQKKCFPESLKT